MGFNEDKNMAIEIAKRINDKGGRTFYVGGYVRDRFLKRDNKDIDIEIHGITTIEVKHILNDLGILDERKVGDHFGVFALKGYDIDIALPRAEKPSGDGGHKDFIIDTDPFIGYKAAAIRRDFTMNAVMQDVLTGEVLDYFGGTSDMRGHIIRHVNEESFKDDPLRVFRAAQFAARFNFTISDDTIKLCSSMDVSKLSHERIAGELDKALLKSNKPSIFFNELRRMGKLDFWFPEVTSLIGVNQPPLHHPEGDAYNHTMMVLDEAAMHRDKVSDKRAFMLSALCHDFGKPLVTVYNKEKQKWTSYSHDIEGVKPASAFIQRIYNDKSLEKYVTNMVALHMRPILIMTDNPKKKSFMKLYDDSINIHDLIYLTKCDHYGRDLPEKELDTFKEKENLFLFMEKEYYELMKKPEVTGNDLIEMGYKEGPIFKEILNWTHKMHLHGMEKDNVLKQVKGQFKIKEENKDKEISERDDF